eukprot:TRINITY_DN3916_c0_g1_i1.p1 TRINITY_DN3916_c0_g1~~TRINITY_DN3916_c0_g1_i1.p1  ORF type:complete len:357 (-),score=83.67 TRINITY_DN3916_c0_g1_i1:637-1707(-)
MAAPATTTAAVIRCSPPFHLPSSPIHGTSAQHHASNKLRATPSLSLAASSVRSKSFSAAIGPVTGVSWQRRQQQRPRLAVTADASSTDGAAAAPPKAAFLTLIRHGESLWNSKNLFTGCVDVPLSAKGVEEAIDAGKRISDIPVDLIFTSALIRAQMTAMLAMTQHRLKKVPVILHKESEQAMAWSKIFSPESEEETIPVVTAYELNERMYGELQGLNKAETAAKYGKEMVATWRRSFDIPPPNGESLSMCADRAVPYFMEKVEPELKKGNNVLIAAHGNSLRAIIMYLDRLTSAEVIELELATGIPLLYVYENGGYKSRGSPLSPERAGVYALTSDLASYREKLDNIQGSPPTKK